MPTAYKTETIKGQTYKVYRVPAGRKTWRTDSPEGPWSVAELSALVAAYLQHGGFASRGQWKQQALAAVHRHNPKRTRYAVELMVLSIARCDSKALAAGFGARGGMGANLRRVLQSVDTTGRRFVEPTAW
jgi:hypothetical protein